MIAPCGCADWRIRKVNQVACFLKLHLVERVKENCPRKFKINPEIPPSRSKLPQKISPKKEKNKQITIIIPKIVTSWQSFFPFCAARWIENLAKAFASSSSSPTFGAIAFLHHLKILYDFYLPVPELGQYLSQTVCVSLGV